MFERVGNLAKRVATEVSRRAFLSRLGKGALGLAAVLGGVLAFPGQARAASAWCCLCFSITGNTCSPANGPHGGCNCLSYQLVHCKDYPTICPRQ
jgi:hypothetical protein